MSFYSQAIQSNILQQISSLPSSIENNEPDSKFKSLLSSKSYSQLLPLNLLIGKISSFDDECLKYYLYLTELFKSIMNNLTPENINKIKVINASISNFIKIFYQNYQNYNDKHKSVTKQFPSFLQIFFKLLKSNFEKLINYSFIGNRKQNNLYILESFFILILTFVNYYPTLLRQYEKQIKEFIQSIFIKYIKNNYILVNCINTYIIVYVSLYKLSPQIDTKFNIYLVQIIDELEYILNYFKPKKLDEDIIIDKSRKEKENIIIYDNIEPNNVIYSIKIVELLFKLIEYLFKIIPNNSYVQANINQLFNLYTKIALEFNLNESNNINLNKKVQLLNIQEGLNMNNYNIFINCFIYNIYNNLAFLITYYNKYVENYYSFFSKFINLSYMNQNLSNDYALYKAYLKLLNLVIINFHNLLPSVIYDIIYKVVYSNFPYVFYDYLSKNDKTIIKIDNNYFKLATKKYEIVNSKDKNKSIFLDFTNDQIKNILILYLEIFNSFVNINIYYNKSNSINIINEIINIILLPSYAKFIFYIYDDVKFSILNLIENSVRNKKLNLTLNKDKIIYYLKSFYTNNELINSKCQNIINYLNSDKEYTIKEIQNTNNICNQIIDLNIKCSEIIKEEYENIKKGCQNKSEFLGRKRENKEEISMETNEVNKEIKKNDNELIFNKNNLKVNSKAANKTRDEELESNNKNIEIKITRKEDEDNLINEDDIEIPDII